MSDQKTVEEAERAARQAALAATLIAGSRMGSITVAISKRLALNVSVVLHVQGPPDLSASCILYFVDETGQSTLWGGVASTSPLPEGVTAEELIGTLNEIRRKALAQIHDHDTCGECGGRSARRILRAHHVAKERPL